jgi:hypothetical protein
MRTADREGEGNQSPFSPKQIGSSLKSLKNDETMRLHSVRGLFLTTVL